MKKILGTSLIAFTSVLFACSGAESPNVPASVVGNNQEPALPSPPAALPDPVNETAGPSPTTPPIEEPTTCAGLSVVTKPAAVFAIDKDKTDYDYKPVDVFATERTTEYATPDGVKHNIRTLSIALTDTAHECAFRKNGLAPTKMYEVRVSVSRDSPTAMPAEIAPGTYDSASASLSAEVEGGERCFVPPAGEDSVGSVGTALHGGMAKGTITITSRTATSIEGVLDVSIATSSSQSKHLRMSFTAPICQPQVLHPACCTK